MPSFAAAVRRTVAALLTVACVAWMFSPLRAGAQEVEEFLSYDVAITLQPGGAMEVTEVLTVRALGQQIRRGIFRDFPTSFPRAAGLGRIEAPFDVVSVLRDGSPEPFQVEAIGGEFGRGGMRSGMRVRIGDANVLLQPGVYEYTIRYRTDRWVHFGDEEDALYWNVTGNGWAFPIRSASAAIRIPELSSAPRLESWTGPEGSTANSATAAWDPATRTATFATRENLQPGSGMTVRLTFPSGQLTPPTAEQQEGWFRLDWGGYVDAGYLILLVIGVYLLMWRHVGIDPAAGPATPRREPPAGYSPATLGFIEQRGYHMSQLSAALVSMALKGAIRIEQDGSGWTLHRLDGSTDVLSEEERELYDGLFDRRSSIELQQAHHATLREGIRRFHRSLSRRLEREYFLNNRRWFLAGLAVSIVGFAALTWRWRFDIHPVALFLGFWLSIWTFAVASLAWRLIQQVRAAFTGGGRTAWAAAGFLALFSVPFFIAEVVVAGFLYVMVPGHLILATLALGGTNVLFYHLLERPTLKGRGVLDAVEGFRKWLGTDDRSLHGGSDRILLFERFLPFAIALELEERWTEAFDDVLGPALVAGGRGYDPHWYDYDRRSRSFSPRSFASSLGSGLAGTLSSASSPPSSSSGGGSSGGGSSGGGGGGGGGGGW